MKDDSTQRADTQRKIKPSPHQLKLSCLNNQFTITAFHTILALSNLKESLPPIGTLKILHAFHCACTGKHQPKCSFQRMDIDQANKSVHIVKLSRVTLMCPF